MMQLGGNTLICPWFCTRVQEQPLCSKADWPVYLQTWANQWPPKYVVAGFSKCSVLFFFTVFLFGPDRSNVVDAITMVVGVMLQFFCLVFFFIHLHIFVHIGFFSLHITFKCLKFILIKRCLRFSPLGAQCYLYLSNLCSKRGRSEKLLINLLL